MDNADTTATSVVAGPAVLASHLPLPSLAACSPIFFFLVVVGEEVEAEVVVVVVVVGAAVEATCKRAAIPILTMMATMATTFGHPVGGMAVVSAMSAMSAGGTMGRRRRM